jgi:hypothetical protein
MTQRERIERLLFVSRVKEAGDEAKARAVLERDFPREAFEQAGLVGFTAYFGGGYCVFEFGFEPSAKGGFDEVFAKLDREPSFRTFLERLGAYVEPVPMIEPGRAATLPVAADIFKWRAESGVTAREPSHPRPGTRREIAR